MTEKAVMEELRARGLFYQSTDDESDDRPLQKLLASKPVTYYCGFDPSAASFTVGNLVSIMLLAHIQRCGHRPIAVVGGGTGMIGDPSGKTELRQLLTMEDVEKNLAAQKTQLDHYLDLTTDPDREPTKGFMVNNAEWLLELNYVDFLREMGRHFSVNRMLAAESVKLRMESESGLSFLEFNYSLLQAYDFVILNRRYDCELQVGGSDQWGNIISGIDLLRRADGRSAHGLTAPLLMTASGQKMGKTEKGAVWLAPDRTSPYDFYQFWVNTDDRDIVQYLGIFTFLSVEEIAEYAKLEGAAIREAKSVLAYEATKITHGEDEARKAQTAAKALFMDGKPNMEGVPTWSVNSDRLASGVPAIELATESKLCDSRNSARRLARQGGLYVNGTSSPEDRVLNVDDIDDDGGILLRAGKKRYMRIVPEG